MNSTQQLNSTAPDPDAPTLAQSIQKIYRGGGYMTVMSECRARAEAARDGKTLVRLFLRHVTEQMALSEVNRQLCKRFAPILEEARRRDCVFFKARLHSDAHSIRLFFNNGVDIQYSRTVGIARIWRKCGLDPHTYESVWMAEGFFLTRGGIWSMEYGLSRTQRNSSR